MPTLTKEEILDAIANMTVLEVADLVKQMEEKFGVSAAAAQVAVASPAVAQVSGKDSESEEQTEFTVVMKGLKDGANKIQVIKAVRAIIPGLGLKEAKELVESDEKPVREGVSKEESEEIKKKLEEAGAVVVIQ